MSAGAFAWGMGSKFANGAIDSFFQGINRFNNYKYNELAAENADKRQRQQFHDLYSYEAQVKQAQKAGLSPSMLFSGTPSQGGATAPQGQGAMGPTINSTPMDLLSLAQLESIKEDTRGKKIENDNRQQTIDADIALKLSQAGLNKASEAYTQTQNTRAQIAARKEGATEGIEIEKAMSEADKMYWESYLAQYNAKNTKQEYEYNLETYKTRVKQVEAEYTNLLVDTKEGETRIQLNQATVDKMAEEIEIAWFNAKVGDMSVKAQEKWFKDQISVQIDKLGQDKELTEAQIKAMKQGQWLNFATNVFGSICNLGAAALHVK